MAKWLGCWAAGVFLAALASAAPEPPKKPVDYQKEADNAGWNWSDKAADIQDSADRFRSKTYKLELSRPQEAFRAIDLRVTEKGKDVFKLTAHHATAFRLRDDVFYYADFHPSASGCTLVAFDLKSRKQLWKTHLKGMGPIDHTKYRNVINLEVGEDVLTVYGNESAGHYVEFVDRVSGKTVGHKQFARD